LIDSGNTPVGVRVDQQVLARGWYGVYKGHGLLRDCPQDTCRVRALRRDAYLTHCQRTDGYGRCREQDPSRWAGAGRGAGVQGEQGIIVLAASEDVAVRILPGPIPGGILCPGEGWQFHELPAQSVTPIGLELGSIHDVLRPRIA
jgi:hypothetical protein